MVKITDVQKNSIADKKGISSGDTLLSINGNGINDVLDYRFYLTEPRITLSLLRGGEEYTVEIRKGQYDDIGLGFETPLMDKKHTCKNKCIFCFIDQNPEGLRDSLYFKDDDSRLSFIHGNYITLTNMNDRDIERIVKMRFSPINISIHTTDPDLRVKMMKNKRAGEVLSYLATLRDAGIKMCGQIVLCKGVNDGDALVRTLTDLRDYYPAMTSVAIVPAGLTKHRDGLYPLSDFTPEEASAIIDTVDRFANEAYSRFGTRLFYPADELYLKAGRAIPEDSYYEDYPQIENGVGMLRDLENGFSLALADLRDGFLSTRPRVISIATGVASYPTVKGFADQIMELCPEIKVYVYKIINKFFGESITVSGLLTGRDIADQLKDLELGEELLIPKNALRAGEDVFLCDMTVSELSEKLRVKITPVAQDGYELCTAILDVEEDQ